MRALSWANLKKKLSSKHPSNKQFFFFLCRHFFPGQNQFNQTDDEIDVYGLRDDDDGGGDGDGGGGGTEQDGNGLRECRIPRPQSSGQLHWHIVIS